MLLTVTVQNVGDRWRADLIKIEHSNNQTPLDTTPANTAEISIVPPHPYPHVRTMGTIKSTEQRWCFGVSEGVRLQSPPPVVLDLPRTTFISRNTTEGKKGEFLGNGKQSFIFS